MKLLGITAAVLALWLGLTAECAAQIITTVVGTGAGGYSGDGAAATNAGLNSPYGVAVDTAGNLFIVEDGCRIRRVDAATGIITTVVGDGNCGFTGDGGAAAAARIGNPRHVIVAGNGDLYINDWGNSRIRKVEAATGVISTYAGNGSSGSGGDNGPATAAQLEAPQGLVLLPNGDLLISQDNRIRCVLADRGLMHVIAPENRKPIQVISWESIRRI